MRNNPTLKNLWKRIDLINRRVQLEHRPRIMKIGKRLPTYGSHMRILLPSEEPSEESVLKAKQILYENNYLPIKAILRRYGVTLGPLQWIIHINDSFDPWDGNTVGWKAKAANHMSKESYRKMMIRMKKAHGIKRRTHGRESK